MKTSVVKIIIFLSITNFKLQNCLNSNESEEEESEYLTLPIELTDQSFADSMINNNFLVLFYWSDIKIPEKMLRTIYTLSEIFNIGNNTNLRIGFIDCEDNNQTCVDNGVTSENLDIYRAFSIKLFKFNEVEAISYTVDSDYIHYVYDFIQENLDLPNFEDVIELRDENFNELTSNGSWFVDFYFPWCIHAKNLEPIWNKLPSVLEQNTSVSIAKVDCVEYEQTICKEYMIRGSPTILWLENGKKIDKFQGNRSVKLFKSFVEKKLIS